MRRGFCTLVLFSLYVPVYTTRAIAIVDPAVQWFGIDLKKIAIVLEGLDSCVHITQYVEAFSETIESATERAIHFC